MNAGLQTFRDDLLQDNLTSKRVEVAAIRVGDGVIVVANQQGTAIALTSPPIEESLDLATFLTSPNGIDSYLRKAKMR